MIEAENRKAAKIIIVVSILLVVALLIGATVIAILGGSDVKRLKTRVEQTAPNEADSVADYLLFWELPAFREDMLKTLELRYETFYYKELPELDTLARDTALLFLDNLYSAIDLSDVGEVTEAYATCYIAALGDTYGYFRSPELTEDFTSDMQGEFVGIGVTVEPTTVSGIPITEVIEGSPAEEAGLLAGDCIIGVDGADVIGKDYESSVGMIRGEAGTSVRIKIQRGDATLEFDIVRRAIVQKTVSGKMLDGNIAYIKITHFKANTAESFAAVLDKLLSDGARGVIFDLSVNPGGYLSSVCDVLSYLVPSGTQLVSFSNGRAPIYASHGTALEPTDRTLGIPAAVICSGATASAAELFTGALRDYNTLGIMKAVTVGDTTYKKGVMQSTFLVTEGYTVTLTTAYYYSPLGSSNEIDGIQPDVFVESADDYLSVAITELEKLIKSTDLTSIVYDMCA